MFIRYYAIKNRKTGQYVSGTDFRYHPPRQIMADRDSPPLLFSDLTLGVELQRRHITDKKYSIVNVGLIEIGTDERIKDFLFTDEERIKNLINKEKQNV